MREGLEMEKEVCQIMTNKELFLKSAEETGIKIADYAITRVMDYEQAANFFRALRINNVKLGMDMATGYSSGDVEIKGVSRGYICLVENDPGKDNYGNDDYFKFKGMVVMNGELGDPDDAPEIFIESDKDNEWLQTYSKKGFQYDEYDEEETRYIGLWIESEGRFVYDRKSVNAYLNVIKKSCYDPEIVAPRMRRIIRNTDREMLVYVNVKGCNKHWENRIIYKARNCTCNDIISAFSPQYREI